MVDEDDAALRLHAYRVTGFQRVVAPLAGLLLIALGVAAVQRREFAGVILIVLGGLFVYAPVRCRLLVSREGIESKMFRPTNNFRYSWSDRNGFELSGNGYQCAIAVKLRDGSRKVLPSTRAWMFEKAGLERTRAQLEEARRGAEPTPRA